MKKYSKDEAKNLTEKLVEFYEENKSKIQVDETMIRRNFVDLLFTYLNWDVLNIKRQPITEKYVYEEERITVNGNKKRTDYTFCGGSGGIANRVFFVEAKKPSTNIDKDFESAFQVRRYGWSAGLYISVLTNFENFAIYNTKNIQPAKTDLPNKGRLDYFKYTDFVARFDELWELFEFSNVQEGSIIEYAKRKGIITDTFIKGEKTVDNAFLMQIEKWRFELAKEIVLRAKNKGVSNDKEKLNYAVQKIIDRIIFLRIIEDRGLETNETLLKASKNYQTLCELFDYADDKYNSGLFHFTDEINRGIPDTITKDLAIYDTVINDIITPLYEGNPYAFDVMPAYILGSVYERFLGKEIDLSGNTVKIDEKPEVRKAGGVYYTPEYIVQYIVENTVSKNTDVKILDPACGSGSFLLVAYQYMLDFYQKKKPHSLLTLQERKQILLDHIYGVDVDEQAVEVARLSLLLKVLEGISKKEIDKLKKKEYILPSLHENIKCGNSLIDDVTVAGKKAFVWEQEFSEIFANGGFDCVIGNPPWGADIQKYTSFLKENYENKTNDSAAYFLEKAKKMAKRNYGMIVPKTISYYSSWESIRNIVLENNALQKVLDVGLAFSDANLESVALIFNKKNKKENPIISTATPLKKATFTKEIKKSGFYSKELMEIANIIPMVGLSEIENNLLLKLYNNSIKLGDITVDSFRSLYIPDKEKEDLKKGKTNWINKIPDVKRYKIEKIMKISLPEKYKSKAKKIMVPRLFFKVLRGDKLVSFPDVNGEFLTTEKFVNVIVNPKYSYLYLCGVINSKVTSYYLQKILFSDTTETSRVMDKLYSQYIILPHATKKQQNQIIKLVDKILELKKEGKRTDILELQIDEIVYELYGLTDEEIGTVE